MQKYFISDDDFKNNKITSDDAFHISNVMRSKPGDVVLVGNNGKTLKVRLTNITKNEVSYEIIEEETGNNELPVFISIFRQILMHVFVGNSNFFGENDKLLG